MTTGPERRADEMHVKTRTTADGGAELWRRRPNS